MLNQDVRREATFSQDLIIVLVWTAKNMSSTQPYVKPRRGPTLSLNVKSRLEPRLSLKARRL